MRAHVEGKISEGEVRAAEDSALRDTINRFERTGSPITSDGEQTKASFATYPLAGIKSLAAAGVVIPCADGHIRQLPRLTAGPFHFGTYAVAYLKPAQQYTRLPVKQAVISLSALSLLYPEDGIPGYSLAEQLRINELGGIKNNLQNVRNAIGAAREYLMVPFKY
jgi:5-methyltetrahydropteroyltriglutamate--homocysteine methyltransferase